MIKKIILSTFLILSIFINAQNEKPDRASFTLTMAIDTVNFYQQEVPKAPYFVKDKILQIYPTEKLFIETEIIGDSIHTMKVVKENLNPMKTITIEFIQNVEEKNHTGMMLTVKNPFEKKLTYEALMFINGRSEWIPTSIIPVRPNLMSFETWSDVIVSLVLVEWKLE